jgi:hypothetical protein
MEGSEADNIIGQLFFNLLLVARFQLCADELRMEMPWWDEAEKLWSKSPKCNPELVSNSKTGASHATTILDSALAGVQSSSPATSLAPLGASDQDPVDPNPDVEDGDYVASDRDGEKDDKDEDDDDDKDDDEDDEEKFVSTLYFTSVSSLS